MSMLSWTGAGAVTAPTTLQIRVTRSFPGRVVAGAPEPPRSLSDEEVVANVAHFTEGRRGPRTRPCTALVLSGVDLQAHDGLAGVVARARALGIERVTLHVGHGDLPALGASALLGAVDAAAITVSDAADVAAIATLHDAEVHVTAVVLLSAPLSRLDGLVDALASAPPDRVVFTWPFPPADPPPPAREAAAAVARVLPRLAVPAGVKGLPACALGDIGLDRLWRSGNRFYVDAGHQRDDALMFFPDVVRFAKADVCRFCAVADRCDGAPDAWLAAGLAGRLEPLGAG